MEPEPRHDDGMVNEDSRGPWDQVEGVPRRVLLLQDLGNWSLVCGGLSLSSFGVLLGIMMMMFNPETMRFLGLAYLPLIVIALSLGLAVVLLATKDLAAIRAGLRDPQGERLTAAARRAGLRGTMLGLGGLLTLQR